jgi:hypothetical protein
MFQIRRKHFIQIGNIHLFCFDVEEREKAMKELEKRHEEDIIERKRQRDEEKRMEIQRLEDLAKSGSTGSRISNDMSRQREETIKERARVADDEKKKLDFYTLQNELIKR